MHEEEINVLSSSKLAGYLGIEDAGVEIIDTLVAYDYKESVRKVRQGYVDLLNDYGTSSGSVTQETQYHNGKPSKFSLFKITSRRSCPEYEKPLEDNSKISVNLKSYDHTSLSSSPDDPSKLTQIFPNDMIEFKFCLSNRSPNRIIFQDLDFTILTDHVWVFKHTTDIDKPQAPDALLSEILERRGNEDATPEELELLLMLRPMLESFYRSIKLALPAPSEAITETKPRFRLSIPGWFKHP